MVGFNSDERFNSDEMIESLKNKDWSSDFFEILDYALNDVSTEDLKKASWLIVKAWIGKAMWEKDSEKRDEHFSAMKMLSIAFDPDKGSK